MSPVVDWLTENEPSFRKNRLPSLYSDLAQLKSANPDGYTANSTAWQAAITRASLAGQLPTEQKILLRVSNQLLEAFQTPQYGIPTGLGVVFDDAVQSGQMMNLKDFREADHSIYTKRWIPSPWAVVRWSLRQAGLMSKGSYDKDGRLVQGQLVLLQGLEQISNELVGKFMQSGQALTDRVMTRDAFTKELAATAIGPLTTAETDVLLRFLERDKNILRYDAHTVKFKSSSADVPEPITQEDTTIASVRALILSLESQISLLSSQVSELQNKAHAAVQAKNKTSALNALKSKKLVERNLQARTDRLHQLEEVYANIEQAVDQVQLMKVMESSAETLKTLNMRVGGTDRVDAVMDDLREQMGQVGEVDQILQEPLDGKAVIDEAEIDDELEAMAREERRKQEEKEAEVTQARLAELGDVPAATEEDKDAQFDRELEQSSQSLERLRLEEAGKDGDAGRRQEAKQDRAVAES